jgi:hypothetical protein
MSQRPVSVYAPGFKFVLELPADKIHHMPPTSLNVTRLVLCANFDARNPASSCPMGNKCKFVHADTTHIERRSIHVNYAWRSLESVTYDRFPAGQMLHVAPPNSKIASDVMDSDMALKTKALVSKRRPLSHCAHYYFNRTCNLGAECQFIHAVFIDPTAKDFQRAPVPSQLGEGRELQLSKKQRETKQRLAQEAVESVCNHQHSAASSTPSHSRMSPVPTPVKSSFITHVTREASSASLPSPSMALARSVDESSLSTPFSTPRHEPLDHLALRREHDVPTPASSNSSNCGGVSQNRGARFRHDPYSLTATRVVMFPNL